MDSQYPIYDLSIPEVYRDWRWKEEDPGYKWLREHFQHIDNMLEISKDTLARQRIIRATFDASLARRV